MFDWAGQALTLLAGGDGVVLVTQMAVEGSTPREAGVRMLVTANKTRGTIGGGNLEHRAIQQARHLMSQGLGAWRVQDYPLGPLLAQCCGGRVRLLLENLSSNDIAWLSAVSSAAASGQSIMLRTEFHADRLERVIDAKGAPASARGTAPHPGDSLGEVLSWPQREVLLFGAGHVGLALSAVLRALPFRLRLIDTRPGLQGAIQGLEIMAPELATRRAGEAGADTVVLIMTHDHALDFNLVAAAMRSPAAFIGVIGSATKRARFLNRLRAGGAAVRNLERMVCPIGITGITSKQPEVIAVAVAAQLLQDNCLSEFTSSKGDPLTDVDCTLMTDACVTRARRPRPTPA